jgi:hypothetical protein
MTSDFLVVLEFVAVLVAISAVYILLLNRLARAAQPLRLKMAATGVRLIQSRSLSDGDRQSVIRALQHAYSVTPVIATAVSILPVAAFIIARGIVKPDARKQSLEMGKFSTQFILSSMATSPIFGLIVLVELLLVALVLIVITGQLGMMRAIVAALARLEAMIPASHVQLAR